MLFSLIYFVLQGELSSLSFRPIVAQGRRAKVSTSQIRHPQKATSGHAAAVAAGLVLAVALTAAPDAMAGTGGTEFDAVNTRITDMIEGGGGKLAAGLGLVAALAASVVRFNIWAVIGAFGIGALAGYGLPIVTSSISALI
ncbi:MAG: hypothetical protein GKS00_01780 [Alphaproteobacteria bacterium]|nr:hypothetical protein [Alphaproteobacteria bacterium]